MTTPLEEALAYRIYRLGRLMRVHLLGLLEPVGLTPEQYFVLYRLHQGGPARQQALVDPLLDDRANVSRQLDVLARRGLVERRPDPDDGRARQIHLTAGGEALIRGFVDTAVAETRQQLFSELPEGDREALGRALDALILTLSR
jgi:DNA-binding MarR family transcriptional regulator